MHDGAPPSQRHGSWRRRSPAAFLAAGWIAGEDPYPMRSAMRGRAGSTARSPAKARSPPQHQLRPQARGDGCAGDRPSRHRQRGGIAARPPAPARPDRDAAQYDAGEKLRRDFTLAQLMPRLGNRPDAALHSPAAAASGWKKTLSDTVIASKQRFARAMKAAGPGLSDLLFDVCCHLRGPRRSGEGERLAAAQRPRRARHRARAPGRALRHARHRPQAHAELADG